MDRSSVAGVRFLQFLFPLLLLSAVTGLFSHPLFLLLDLSFSSGVRSDIIELPSRLATPMESSLQVPLSRPSDMLLCPDGYFSL